VRLPPLIIGDLTIPIPIIQGGMGVRVSTASLASAVANCGGAGTIASIGLGFFSCKKDAAFIKEECVNLLINEIRQARALTKGVIGVNILTAVTNFAELVRAAVSESVDYIIAGAGLPLRLPEFAKDSSTKLIPIVSSGRVAQLIIKSWKKRYDKLPDAIIVEGPLAGGHLGFSKQEIESRKENALEKIVSEVLAVTASFQRSLKSTIPVIAAGGIFTGADIGRFLKLGVSGVQMGTRFVATNECEVPQAFKEKYINAKDEDIILIDSPVGLPGRVIRTKFVDSLDKNHREKFSCIYKCLKPCDVTRAPYCIAERLINAVNSDKIEEAVVFAGFNAARVKKIVPVKELMAELVQGAEHYLDEGS